MKNEWRDRPNPTHNTQITPRQAGQQTHAKPGNAHHTHNPKTFKPQALTTELQRPCSQQKAATTINYAEDGPLSDKQKPPSSAPTEATYAANKKLPPRQIMQRTDPSRTKKPPSSDHQLRQHMQPQDGCHHDKLCRGRTPLRQRKTTIFRVPTEATYAAFFFEAATTTRKITVTTEQYQAQWTHNPHLPQCAMTHKAPQAHFCWK